MRENIYKSMKKTLERSKQIQKLGVVGMIRFLQYYDKGHGDYSRERHS
jgi:hypothetical protein